MDERQEMGMLKNEVEPWDADGEGRRRGDKEEEGKREGGWVRGRGEGEKTWG